MMSLKRYNLAAVLLLLLGGYGSAQAAIAPDRTRLVFRGEDKSISVDLKNANSKLPYLAQSWVEDEKGVKITSPLIVVPPVQRIEPSAIGQVKIQGMPALASLPQGSGNPFFITTCAKFRRKATSPIRCKSPCKRASKFFTARRRYRKSICSIPGNTRSPFSVRAMAIR
ncbi:fimbrial chaperone yfcS [Salmonella enterica subsp. enterica]|uniref:Fimbrial chaperone yfcS n=1 Tax=Salmonella enterica I TaxID=59201 RepID=A0A447MXU2_SALET|nr:fimbrial chaperone yfcS [Salmonella enterica subsp. enterica]